jgi:hypothetical protein
VKLDAACTREALARLRAAKTSIFGADSHRFLLNPPLAEAEVLAFERQHGVRLPVEYRHFLTGIGNGGAGPYYGIFRLGERDDGFGFRRWREEKDIVGVLSEPFPLEMEWNDLAGMPPADLLESNEAEYFRLLDEFDDRYYWRPSLMNGAIPICHEGCALRIWLVVTGVQAGHLWHDGRSDRTGVKPLRLANGAAATFSFWYNEWLEEALRGALGVPRRGPR